MLHSEDSQAVEPALVRTVAWLDPRYRGEKKWACGVSALTVPGPCTIMVTFPVDRTLADPSPKKFGYPSHAGDGASKDNICETDPTPKPAVTRVDDVPLPPYATLHCRLEELFQVVASHVELPILTT